jgi:hypothetical protein
VHALDRDLAPDAPVLEQAHLAHAALAEQVARLVARGRVAERERAVRAHGARLGVAGRLGREPGGPRVAHVERGRRRVEGRALVVRAGLVG